MQVRLIGEHLQIGDRLRTIGDRHRQIGEHTARIVTGPAATKPVRGLSEPGGQSGPLRDLAQQHSAGVRHHPTPVDSDDRRNPRPCNLHQRSAFLAW